MSFVVTETTFQPCWSNPVWDALEYPIGTESTRILQLAASVTAALPTTHTDALTLPHPAPLFKDSSPFWQRWFVTLFGTSASALCAACAFSSESEGTLMQQCWEACARRRPGHVAASDNSAPNGSSVDVAYAFAGAEQAVTSTERVVPATPPRNRGL